MNDVERDALCALCFHPKDNHPFRHPFRHPDQLAGPALSDDKDALIAELRAAKSQAGMLAFKLGEMSSRIEALEAERDKLQRMVNDMTAHIRIDDDEQRRLASMGRLADANANRRSARDAPDRSVDGSAGGN